MNIWDFEYEKNVRIKTDDDQEFVGTVIDIQYADETENGENTVAIETDHGIFGISESEIVKIEKMKQ